MVRLPVLPLWCHAAQRLPQYAWRKQQAAASLGLSAVDHLVDQLTQSGNTELPGLDSAMR